jgi:hypothetical protein
MKQLLFFITAIFFTVQASAQFNPCTTRISLLTCAPADELYATFGHTAIRLTDSSSQNDFVFNYGTFNFEEPDFYTKFMRGKLNYYLSVAPYNDFVVEYIEDKRTIYEQELHLNCDQKQLIIEALQKNMQGGNRYYKYDFLFDNCTTRVRDIIFKSIPAAHVPNPITPEGTTCRDMLYVYLDRGGKPWSKLGIDIVLGSRIDKKVDIRQSMFLPEYLMKGLDSAVLGNNTHFAGYHKILLNETAPDTSLGKNDPLFIAIAIALLMIIFSFLPYKWAGSVLKITDSFLLYTTGLLGILIVFMWLGTDHAACANNYNLLWALPTNFIAAFMIWKKRNLTKQYFLFAAILTAFVLVCWFILPQHFNIALLPLVAAGFIRYIKLYQAL